MGEASCLQFAEAGWSVACVDMDEKRVGQVARQIDSSGGESIAVVADVSTAEGNRRMVDDTFQAFGGLDALHTNATLRAEPMSEASTLADWDRLHHLTLRGAFLGIKHVIPGLRKRGGGAIVMTTAPIGGVGDPRLAAMSGGLRSLCRSAATGYGRENIRVNTICPGTVETSALRKTLAAERSNPEVVLREIAERLPLRRLALPRDVAKVAVFLASPEASYVSGTDIVVDGGLLAVVS